MKVRPSNLPPFSQGADWKDELDKHAMDESWEEFGDSCYSRMSDFPPPFQAVLLRFLDQRAPLPGLCQNLGISILYGAIFLST